MPHNSYKSEARTTLLSDAAMDRAYYTPSPSYHPERTQYFQHQDLEDYTPYEPKATGGYHHREGLMNSTPNTAPSKPPWLYIPNSRWTWTFTIIALVQAVVGIALETFIFVEFQISLKGAAANWTEAPSPARIIPTYLALFVFGFLYQLLLVYDALRMKNTIQVIGLCLYNVGLLIEAGIQQDQIHDAVSTLEDLNGDLIDEYFWEKVKAYVIAMPCVIALGTVLFAIASWKLYDEFAWTIYKHISADLRLKRRYLSYQIYVALLKFDFFFFLAFTVQFLVDVSDTEDVEHWLTIAAIPITVVLLYLAAYWARKENIWGTVIVMFVYIAALAYFIFKLVRMYWAPEARIQDYRPARRSLTTFAILTIIVLIVTIVYAVIVSLNFNKGLKPHLSTSSSRARANSTGMDKLYSHDVPLSAGLSSGPGPSRMTID